MGDVKHGGDAALVVSLVVDDGGALAVGEGAQPTPGRSALRFWKKRAKLVDAVWVGVE